jgi:hypothetical protein
MPSCSYAEFLLRSHNCTQSNRGWSIRHSLRISVRRPLESEFASATPVQKPWYWVCVPDAIIAIPQGRVRIPLFFGSR